ncbi:hypothetical protein P9209_14825 [Prescottella defluvii]|nr:hypothetical protein P9209_14825 [Prescottella defluvii]
MKAARVVSATAAVALVLLPLGIGVTVAVRAAQQGQDLQAWPLVLLWVVYGSFVAAVAFRVLRRTAVTEAAEALAQARRDDDARVLDEIPPRHARPGSASTTSTTPRRCACSSIRPPGPPPRSALT